MVPRREARARVEDGLDATGFCTEDVVRTSALAATGVRVEAEIAQRARDLGDADAAADAFVVANCSREDVGDRPGVASG